MGLCEAGDKKAGQRWGSSLRVPLIEPGISCACQANFLGRGMPSWIWWFILIIPALRGWGRRSSRPVWTKTWGFPCLLKKKCLKQGRKWESLDEFFAYKSGTNNLCVIWSKRKLLAREGGLGILGMPFIFCFFLFDHLQHSLNLPTRMLCYPNPPSSSPSPLYKVVCLYIMCIHIKLSPGYL